ncbi:MAG: uridine kinase [Microbacteriaceae bacterium]|nr:uridine kinase [Microbacteriaceae bacterium]
MARFSPAKKDVLDALVDDILHNYGRGRAVVAVDGTNATRSFADDLAASVTARGHGVFRASMDRFYRPEAERAARGQSTAAEVYANAADYSTFRRVLVEPFRLGGSTAFVTAAFDVESNTVIPAKWLSGPKDALLIVDGMFLNRPELRGLWNFSVWLEPDVAAPVHSEVVADSQNSAIAEFPAQRAAALAIYLAESSPRTTATAIMNATDPEHPRRVFADAC